MKWIGGILVGLVVGVLGLLAITHVANSYSDHDARVTFDFLGGIAMGVLAYMAGAVAFMAIEDRRG